MRSCSRFVVVLISGTCAMIGAPLALGQSFNIDIKTPGSQPLPARTYGAAGPVGVWNAGVGSTPVNLVGLNGAPTGAFVTTPAIYGPTQTFPVAGASGNDSILLADGQIMSDVLQPFQFGGLRNGNYNLIL